MAVGVADVEVPLAPRGVHGCGLGLQARRDEDGMDLVRIGNVEDHSPPELDRAIVNEQIHKTRAELDAREYLTFAAIDNGLPEDFVIEVHGSVHVVHAEGYRVYLHAVVFHYDVPSTAFTPASPNRATPSNGG